MPTDNDEILFCSTCNKPILRGDIVCKDCSKLFQPVNSREEIEEFAKSLNNERQQRFAEFDNEEV